MTDLGTFGGDFGIAYAVNSRGQVVGGAGRADFTTGPFIWHNGTMTEISSGYGYAYGINERGQVVGQIYAPDFSSSSAYVWENGTMTMLPGLGGTQSLAVGINARGQIVGQASDAGGMGHAVMWQNGVITDLGSLGGTFSYAYTINARGIACGASSLPSGEQHAAVYQNGTVTDLGTLGGTFSSCFLGSSNRGQLVGYSSRADFSTAGWVTINGVMTDLNTVTDTGGAVLIVAYGINERGQIVAAGTSDGGLTVQGYLLTP